MPDANPMKSYRQSVDQLFAVPSGNQPSPAPSSTSEPEQSVEPELPAVSVAEQPQNAVAPPPAQPPNDEPAAPASPSAAPEAPPSFTGMTSWQSEYEWVREERRRLEAYTLSQFALVKQQREELLGRKAGIEEALALREQELNRKLKLVADASAVIEAQNRELAEREAALAAQLQRLENTQQEMIALQQASLWLQKENESQRLLAEQLRMQTAHLQEAARAAGSELAVLDLAVQRRKEAAEEERTDLAARRAQLEQRFAVLEGADESLRRRVAEIDQLEAQIRRELELRENELEREHQELERARTALRQQPRPGADESGGAAGPVTPLPRRNGVRPRR